MNPGIPHKKVVIPLALFLAAQCTWGQQIGDNTYWIYFTDKKDNGYEISQPEQFLSRRSIERRGWQGLGIDHTDEPVTRAYLDEIRNAGAKIRHVSRWLNGVAITGATPELYGEIMAKPFTDTIPWEPDTDELFFPSLPAGNRFDPPGENPGFDYGEASDQVFQVKMDILHRIGYMGSGVWIGVLDAGFYNVDSLPSFEQMINDGRLMGTRNFVDNIPVFRSPSSHGMSVLSIMGAAWNGHMVGTAPRASYFLCITENSSSESRIEEIAWIEAAEFLDSLGCDLFNTSLGYSVFDDNLFDYAYENMDGQTTFISRAASMTASKGIICCVSAGNEGNKSWHYLTAPSDASDILGVGAVDDLGQISNFSSRGPSFDGRVKPDVVAMGKLAWIQHWSGTVVQRDGTSFSSPLITGSVASLWQAYPTVPATEIIDAVRQSGDRYERPDDNYGYGLPSFSEALQSISSTRNNFRDGEMVVYPNPASDRVTIRIPGDNAGKCLTRLYDMTGRLILSRELELPGMLTIPPGHAGSICILEVNSASRLFRIPLIIH